MDFSTLNSEDASEVLAPAEETEQPELTLDDLAQEVRRLGRELFKVNRATERHQEAFAAALTELQQLSMALARMPEQSAEAVFQVKAALCQEMLPLADALEASCAAAQAVRAQLAEQAQQPARGLIFRFTTVRRMRAGLVDAAAAMSQWSDGQELLRQRVLAVLRAAHVRAIPSVGQPFDPAMHRAVSVERRSDVPAGTVVAEELKGYALAGRVLRYAEVVVAKNE